MTSATHFCGSQAAYEMEGTACSHAFTFLGCMDLEKHDGSGTVRLVKMRNPWGIDEYYGKYSDNSSEWTPEDRKTVNDKLGDALTGKSEGIFFLDLDSYMKNFQLTQVNLNTDKWYLDYFLRLDDTTNGSHEITVTSDIDQVVHVGMHGYQDRTYGWYDWECDGARNAVHSLRDNKSGSSVSFSSAEGSAWLQPIQFSAGETRTFSADMDWYDSEIAKDFSLTAWGTGGKTSSITVANTNG